jgi:hypothetical protein
VVKTGKTPVLEGAEWRKLLESIPAVTFRDLRDRALIATLTYSFARITAARKMRGEDFRPPCKPEEIDETIQFSSSPAAKLWRRR